MKKNQEAERIFHDINFDNYIVQYQGDIEGEISKVKDTFVTIINDKYAIVSVKKDLEINLSEETYFNSIVYVNQAIMFTLQEISPIQASQSDFLQVETSPIQLTGKDVIVALIDSGIDYLSEEFMDENGQTRIEGIWDQTIISENIKESNVPFGTFYNRDQINSAIMAFREGKSPYDIVQSIDEIGHGTNMAGIIGATGKNPLLKGVVPECNFIIIKLIQDYSYNAQFKDTTVPVYNITVIFAALQFLYEYVLLNNKPLVIYFPLGSSLGNHKGNGLLEEFIESVSSSSGIITVAGTGNERDEGGHASGVVGEIFGVEATGAGVMELEVAPEQQHLWVEIWIDYPNISSLEILSPSGESTGIIPVIINYTKDYNFVFEKTSIKVNYFFPEENTGDELIRIRFYNLQPGIWRLRIIANYFLGGKYNAWIPQKGITVKNTRFSYPDPFGTITNPANSNFITTIAAYNQNNNNLLNYSGMASLESFVDKIDVAAGGVNALTVAPGNKTSIVNGTSVSAAVVAGICAMLFQWGIVDGHDPYIYSQTVRAYLAKGAIKRPGDISPNPYWGYGIINVPKIFENML